MTLRSASSEGRVRDAPPPYNRQQWAEVWGERDENIMANGN